MNTHFRRKHVTLIVPICALSLAGTNGVQVTGHAQEHTPGRLLVTGAEAFENQPVIHFQVLREGDATRMQTADFLTIDETEPAFSAYSFAVYPPARAGVDYEGQSGTVTWLPGQTSATVAIGLRDNGLVDSTRQFRLVVANPRPPIQVANHGYGLIKDNEFVPTQLDPTFVPEPVQTSRYSPIVRPDGTVLIGQRRLLANGSIDSSFNLALTNNATPVHYSDDGRTLYRTEDGKFSWVTEDGSVVGSFSLGAIASFWVQRDGTLLFTRYHNPAPEQHVYSLHRADTGGALDVGFKEPRFNGHIEFVTSQPDGRILVTGEFSQINNAPHGGLVRFLADGTLDPTFPVNGYKGVFVRNGGKIITEHEGRLIQLDSSGDRDWLFIGLTTGFLIQSERNVVYPWLSNVSGTSFWGAEGWLSLPSMVEQSDGRLLVLAYLGIGGDGWGSLGWQAQRLTADGSFDESFPRILGLRGPAQFVRGDGRFAMTRNGEVLFSGMFSTVHGFPRAGMARFLNQPARPDFRALSGFEWFPSESFACVRLVRTGPSVEPASVQYLTADGSARAGVDYVTRAGSLEFKPLEVSKTVAIPLLLGNATERLTFQLVITNASAGYASTPPVQISILPELRLKAQTGPAGRSILVTGTEMGRRYDLLVSTSVTGLWYPTASVAGGTPLVLSGSNLEHGGVESSITKFYRLRYADRFPEELLPPE